MAETTALKKAMANESSTKTNGSLIRRLHYWWSLSMAGALLLVLGPPILTVAWILNKHYLVYPVALFGARSWLRLSGVEVKVIGLEQLDPRQTYVFVSNHRSYLDTATLFGFLGRRIGLLAKKELLKVPILGVGMGFVNVMAIDRSNRESAIRTADAAAKRIQSGVSFGVFVEGTRAKPGELLPFKKGAFYMARQAGVPVVPVAITNSDLLMGKGTGEARGGTLEVVIKAPLKVMSEATDQEIADQIALARKAIAEELAIEVVDNEYARITESRT